MNSVRHDCLKSKVFYYFHWVLHNLRNGLNNVENCQLSSNHFHEHYYQWVLQSAPIKNSGFNLFRGKMRNGGI